MVVDRMFDEVLVSSVERAAERLDVYRRVGVDTLQRGALIETEDERRL